MAGFGVIYCPKASVTIQTAVISVGKSGKCLIGDTEQARKIETQLMDGMIKMTRLYVALTVVLFGLAACLGGNQSLGPDGKPIKTVFRIGVGDKGKIQFRVLDSVNALRVASGLNPVELSAELNAAAATHSRDMSVQNRPWHFGSDGSSPIDRVARTGYAGRMLGENISETFESDVETLAAWMQEAATRDVILSPDARHMGISWFQESNGKIWWTQIFGG